MVKKDILDKFTEDINKKLSAPETEGYTTRILSGGTTEKDGDFGEIITVDIIKPDRMRFSTSIFINENIDQSPPSTLDNLKNKIFEQIKRKIEELKKQ